jgi:hypothetical protein
MQTTTIHPDCRNHGVVVCLLNSYLGTKPKIKPALPFLQVFVVKLWRMLLYEVIRAETA